MMKQVKPQFKIKQRADCWECTYRHGDLIVRGRGKDPAAALQRCEELKERRDRRINAQRCARVSPPPEHCNCRGVNAQRFTSEMLLNFHTEVNYLLKRHIPDIGFSVQVNAQRNVIEICDNDGNRFMYPVTVQPWGIVERVIDFYEQGERNG